jgi:hypothetical protein
VHDEIPPIDYRDWVSDELATIDLGDIRLNKRAELLLSRFGDKPLASIPAACNGWSETKAAYRFLSHERVTPDHILKPHFQATRERVSNADVLLCIEDTSEIDYSTKKDIVGLGPLNYEARQGLYLHPMLAVTPDRLCHGLLSWQRIIREPGSLGNKSDTLRPIEEKESIRWRNGYDEASRLARDQPQTKVLYVADREADFFELLCAGDRNDRNDRNDAESGVKAGFVIRSQHDRALQNGKKLRESLKQAPILGEVEFTIPARKGRTGRAVLQDLRALRVTIDAPSHLKDAGSIELTAVLALERNPPKGEDPICWILLTSEEVNSGDEAAQVLQWYLCRWQIEIFFRILKSGCKIEELQLQDVTRIEPAIAFYCIVAWRTLWLTMIGRSCPEVACDIVFDTEEWHAAYLATYRKRPPDEPPTLDAMIKMIACLGGFLGRKGDGYPGPQTIWIGLQRVRYIAEGIAIQKEATDSS